MDDRSPTVVAARRTPFTTAGRGLARVDAAGLAGPVLAALVSDVDGLARGDRDRPRVDDVVLGNCCGPGGDVARVAVLAGGLGIDVPAVTVDRQCGSGLEAIRLGAALVAAGHADLVLAGGMESASTAPWRLPRSAAGAEAPRPYTRAPFAPREFPDPEMGAAAEAVAAACGISRERQDVYAARSHARAVASRDAGVFDAELVAVGDVRHDERPRAGLTASTLSRFRPVFADEGTVTAGNSCGINDGSAAVALVPEEWRAQVGAPGLRVLGTAVAGVDPALPGLGPVPAVQAVLAAAGLKVGDLAVFEVIEAFAAQVLACTDALGIHPLGADAEQVCPEGGAIALGHPWGASGAMLVVRLFSRLVRQAHRRPTGPASSGPVYGLAACAIGGGQGIAVLVERIG